MAVPVRASLNDTYLTPSHSRSDAKLLKLHHSEAKEEFLLGNAQGTSEMIMKGAAIKTQ